MIKNKIKIIENKYNVFLFLYIIFLSFFYIGKLTDLGNKIPVYNNVSDNYILSEDDTLECSIPIYSNRLHALHMYYIEPESGGCIPEVSVKNLDSKSYKIKTEKHNNISELILIFSDNLVLSDKQLDFKIKTNNCKFKFDNNSVMNLQLKYLSMRILILVELLLITIIFLLSILIYAVCKSERLRKIHYLVFVIIIGFFYLFIIPPFGIPDEKVHFNSAYEYSNRILGTSTYADYGTLNMRNCDTLILQNEYFTNKSLKRDLTEILPLNQWRKYYLFFAKNFYKPISNEQYVQTDGVIIFTPIQYIPQILGITFARLLSLNQFFLFYFGRIFSLLIYSSIIFLILKITRINDDFIFVFLFLPMIIQESCSYTYDAFCNVVSISFVLLVYAYLKQNRSICLILSFLFAFLLLFAKSKCYSPLILIYLQCFINKGLINLSYKQKKYSICFFSVLILSLYILFPIFFQNIPQEHKAIEFYGNLCSLNSIGVILNHPIKYTFLIIESCCKCFFELFSQFSGITMAVRNITVEPFISIPLFLCIFFSLIHNKYNFFNSFILLIIIVIVTIGIYTAMFLTEPSNYNNFKIIYGVQGRYFIPIGLIISFFISKQNIINLNSKIQDNFIYEMIILDIFTGIDVLLQILI